MNDLSPRKQNSPIQVFVAFLATLAVGIVVLAAVAQAAGSNDDNTPTCTTDSYSTVGQVIDGVIEPAPATVC
jgi:hypothetical protein